MQAKRVLVAFLSAARKQWTTGRLMHQHCQVLSSVQVGRGGKGLTHALMKVLDMPYDPAYNLHRDKRKSLRVAEPENVLKAARVLQTFNFTREQMRTYPELLAVLPATIEQHMLFLQECGFTDIKPQTLLNYRMLSRKPIKVLKGHGLLKQEVDVVKNLLNILSAPKEVEESVNLELSLKEPVSLSDINHVVLKYYLRWRLDGDLEEIQDNIHKYPRLKHKSLKYLLENISILLDEIGFTCDKIRRNTYLLHAHPHNTRDTLTRIPKIADVPIQEVFRTRPKIILKSTDSLLKTIAALKEFGIPPEAVRKCIEIFTLSGETIQDRLKRISQIPQMNAMKHNTRVLRLVYYYRKALRRMEILEDNQMKCSSIHILSAHDTAFERYCGRGSDKTRGVDTVKMLSESLQVSPQEIRACISSHPFWCSIPVEHIQGSLKALLQMGFTRDQVLNGATILLYPQSAVKEELKRMRSRRELEPYKDWETCPQVLNLCLYFVERECRFSGSAVWPDAAPVSKVDPESVLLPVPQPEILHTHDLQC